MQSKQNATKSHNTQHQHILGVNPIVIEFLWKGSNEIVNFQKHSKVYYFNSINKKLC